MKNPGEIGAIVRQNATLVAEPIFEVPDVTPNSVDAETPPMHMFGKYSRVIMTIISGGKTVSANLHPEDIKTLMKKTEFCMEHSMFAEKQAEQKLPLAYTEEIKSFKKTAAEAVLKDGVTVEKLTQQMNFLAKNIDNPQYSKFRAANVKQANALKNAIDLLNAGKLVAVTGAVESKTLYEGLRIPNHRKVNENGKTKVVEMKILYDAKREVSPITVVISNMLAKPVVQATGQIRYDAQSAEQKTEFSFSMTIEEFYSLLAKIYETKLSFNIVNYNAQRRLADGISRKNREAFAQQAGK